MGRIVKKKDVLDFMTGIPMLVRLSHYIELLLSTLTALVIISIIKGNQKALIRFSILLFIQLSTRYWTVLKVCVSIYVHPLTALLHIEAVTKWPVLSRRYIFKFIFVLSALLYVDRCFTELCFQWFWLKCTGTYQSFNSLIKAMREQTPEITKWIQLSID